MNGRAGESAPDAGRGMIEALIRLATGGDPGAARDRARSLADPALVPEFRAVFARKLSAVERKLAYEFLEHLARNARSPEVTAFVLARLGAEKSEAAQLAILGTIWLLEDVDSAPILPFLAAPKPRVRHAAIEALGACAGDRPARLVEGILRASEGGEEARVCASALARCGDEASADEVIAALGRLEPARANALAIVYLLSAASALCGPRHRDWLRGELAGRRDAVQRWLLLLGLCRVGTQEDCGLVAAQVEDYLAKPTGPIHLMTGHTPIAHRTTFQAGMSFLERMCPDRHAALAVRARDARLPPEDRAFLDRSGRDG